MQANEAAEMVRMLAPVGGVRPVEPREVDRARLCRRLYDHLRGDGGFIPLWLRAEVHHAA